MSKLLETITKIKENQKEDITTMRLYITTNFPNTIKALTQIDNENLRPKRRKGYNLLIRESKAYGQRLFARFTHKGKKIPTKFNTYTDNEIEADLYIKTNKDRLIEGYYSRKEGRIYKMLESFFETKQDNISDRVRKEYDNVMKKRFIPFLKEEKIKEFGQINKKVLIKFQDTLLKTIVRNRPMQPQSVNNNMKAVRKVFEKIARQGVIDQNPCYFVRGLPVNEKNRKIRGCYELDKIQDVFCRKWKDELLYLLCLMIYTTGMRNGEIKRIRLNDIQSINGCWFVKIEISKTANGIRMIPLHKSVYDKLKMWGIKNKIDSENPLFDIHETKFNYANKELARRLKVSDEELARENIVFYSGRHYWKTLMSAEGLGEDIEEIWMGHKVSGNVCKLYNHRDKQGKTRMVKKAKQMFSILDRFIFKTKP